jgi:hypothetical protein
MGCASSEPYSNVYKKDVELRKSQRFFESLKLAEREIGRLHEVFKTIDRTRNFAIAEVELLEYLGLHESNFFTALLGFTDHKKLIFEDFVKVLWRFCSLPSAEIGLFPCRSPLLFFGTFLVLMRLSHQVSI